MCFQNIVQGEKSQPVVPSLSVITYLQALPQVHRSILAQDGSIFEDVFSPSCSDSDARSRPPTTIQGLAVERGGDSDDTPIYLQGDSVDEFRDLLWSLYAL